MAAPRSSASAGSSSDPQPHSHPHPPKQRKLNRVHPQLKRNAACLPCRRRRIKCDAGKPHCSSCVRSFHFLQRTNPDAERDSKGVQCWYDDEAEDHENEQDVHAHARVHVHGQEPVEGGLHDLDTASGPRKGSKRKQSHGQDTSRDVIKQLEGRVAELQNALQSGAPPSSSITHDPAAGIRKLGGDQSGHHHQRTNSKVTVEDDPLSAADPNGLWSNMPDIQSLPNAQPSGSSTSTFQDMLGSTHSVAPNMPVPPGTQMGMNTTPSSGFVNFGLPPYIDQTQISAPPLPQLQSQVHTRPPPPLPIQPAHQIQATLNDFGGINGNPIVPVEDSYNVINSEKPMNVSDGIDNEAGKLGGPFLDLLWPGWPPRLPTPAMVEHLCDTFFTMVPSVSRIVHRQSFMTRLALPPTHTDFPHPALLHAICATAALYSAAVNVRGVKDAITKSELDAKMADGKGLKFDPSNESCFAERNARYAIDEMTYELTSPRKLFEILQAMLVLAHWGQANAKWIDGWVLIGEAVRLTVALGLQQHRHADDTDRFARRCMLGDPRSDVEREERRAVMYQVMVVDYTSAASSGWPNAIMYDEMTARLPATRFDCEKGGHIPENTQSYHSPDLFVNHPVVDGSVMMLKGKILVGRVCKLARRIRAMDPNERPFVKDSLEFRLLDGDIGAFKCSFPPALRDPIQHLKGHSKAIDADLISAHFLPHVAAILLHEPFADLSDPMDTSATRILTETRACLNIVYLMVSSSADISFSVTPITSSARTLLLFLRRALEIGDHQSTQTFRSEISVFRMAFTALATRFVMGARHLQMLDLIIERVEQELDDGSGSHVADWASSLASAPALGQAASLWRSNSCPKPWVNGPLFKRESASDDKPWFPTGHPDSMLAIRISRTEANGGCTATASDILDGRRGYVKKSPGRSASSASAGAGAGGGSGSAPGSAEQSPNDPLAWINWTQQGQGARVTMLSPEESERRGSV